MNSQTELEELVVVLAQLSEALNALAIACKQAAELRCAFREKLGGISD